MLQKPGGLTPCRIASMCRPSRAETLTMNLEDVPLLQIQRDIQALPRDYERFRKYLRIVGAADSPTLKRPTLLMMNPMGKEHVTGLLDALLAMDAETIAAAA